ESTQDTAYTLEQVTDTAESRTHGLRKTIVLYGISIYISNDTVHAVCGKYNCDQNPHTGDGQSFEHSFGYFKEAFIILFPFCIFNKDKVQNTNDDDRDCTYLDGHGSTEDFTTFCCEKAVCRSHSEYLNGIDNATQTFLKSEETALFFRSSKHTGCFDAGRPV